MFMFRLIAFAIAFVFLLGFCFPSETQARPRILKRILNRSSTTSTAKVVHRQRTVKASAAASGSCQMINGQMVCPTR